MNSNENTQRMSELGGFEKMMDFILWATDKFSNSTTAALKALHNQKVFEESHIISKGQLLRKSVSQTTVPSLQSKPGIYISLNVDNFSP